MLAVCVRLGVYVIKDLRTVEHVVEMLRAAAAMYMLRAADMA